MTKNASIAKSITKSTTNNAPNRPRNAPATNIPLVRGISAWLAVVRTYQVCSEVLAQRIAPLSIKLAQHDVMMNLLQQPQQTQQQLAEKSFVTKSHMSGVLTEMVELGWLKRIDSDVDKRSKIVSLTPQGLALAKRAYTAQAEVVNAMMSPLTDKQIASLEQVSRAAVVSLHALAAD
jgi:DNA-binding MarR family transcriptional regulator